jgi:hypothetical protein
MSAIQMCLLSRSSPQYLINLPNLRYTWYLLPNIKKRYPEKPGVQIFMILNLLLYKFLYLNTEKKIIDILKTQLAAQNICLMYSSCQVGLSISIKREHIAARTINFQSTCIMFGRDALRADKTKGKQRKSERKTWTLRAREK